YKTTMWGVIGLLAVIALFLLYKFRNSNAVTREAKLKLAETEAEFEEHRQKNLEQQQVLRRKLQDEINKNKSA
ncbi:MAG: tRNA (guanine-N1)-methyltransferase, partial [Bacteroidota bacterium]